MQLTRLLLVFLLASLSQVEGTYVKRAVNRRDGERKLQLYQNPCTGSWSEDVNNAEYTNCDEQTQESSEPIERPNRVDDIENTGLDCSLNPSLSSAPYVPTRVEFWYGVESTSIVPDVFKAALDKLIFNSISLWCYEDSVSVGTVHVGGDNRKLRTSEVSDRRLGILSTTSGPTDQPTDYDCDYELEDANNSCFVMKGGLTLVARETDNLNYTMAAIRDTIEWNMLTDALLGSSIPTVKKITYMGDSEDDIVNGGDKDRPVEIVPDEPVVGVQVRSTDDKNLRYILPVAFAAMAIILVAILLLALRRRRSERVEEHKSRAIMIVDEDLEDWILVGTGDPPGSFHQGLYHYMPDGAHYLSTNCKTCYETRQNGFGENGFGDLYPIAEETDSAELHMGKEDYLLFTANSNDLGGRHVGMDVHDCGSATCKICSDTKHNVSFLPSNMVANKQPSGKPASSRKPASGKPAPVDSVPEENIGYQTAQSSISMDDFQSVAPSTKSAPQPYGCDIMC